MLSYMLILHNPSVRDASAKGINGIPCLSRFFLTNCEPLFVMFSLVFSCFLSRTSMSNYSPHHPVLRHLNLFSSFRASVSLHRGCIFRLCNFKSLWTESHWLCIITDMKFIIDEPRTTVDKLHLHTGLLFSRYVSNVSKDSLLTWRRTRWMGRVSRVT
jgi:hypothetical protein